MRVTSEPVPAVVGTAMQGAAGNGDGFTGADDFEIVFNHAGIGQHRRDGLGRVDYTTAAEAHDDLAAGVAGCVDCFGDNRYRRLASLWEILPPSR